MQDFQNSKVSDNTELEKMKIIKSSADIIKNEIRQLKNNTTFYSTVEEIELLHFLKSLISCKSSDLLVASIAQAIIQNIGLRSTMTQEQLLLAVILHCHFECRYMIHIFHQFGLCVSYSKSLILKLALPINLVLTCMTLVLNRFSVADNHHGITIVDPTNGLNTFHGMGIIACLTITKKCWLQAIKRTTIESSGIAKTAKIEQKILQFFCYTKTLKDV